MKIQKKKKKTRANENMQIQNEISRELNAAKVGNQYSIIVDSIKDDYITGRTQHDSPEVDNEVFILNAPINNNPVNSGDFINVKITSSDDYDLYAEIISRP